MPRGNPQNFKPLTTEEARKRGSKGGKASAEARRNYATFRECFKHRMTDEMMEKAFDKLWRMFINKGNLNAFDRINELTDTGENMANNITITFATQEMEEYGD